MNSTHYNKEIFVKDYFDIHNHYVKNYNQSNCKILILMAVGSVTISHGAASSRE